MALSGQILMLEPDDGESRAILDRIQQLGVDVISVSSLAEAREHLADRRQIISGVLVPTNLPGGMTHRELKREIRELNKAGPAQGLVFVSTGKRPDRDERKRLRAAGMQLALWEPLDDGTLRFQINRAVSGDTNDHNRRKPRVPTYLFARVHVGGRTKDTIVYSLSVGGAFLETPRASVNGAHIDVELRLPGSPIMTRALVIFTNVPGNLQRPNLPLGMGVKFEGLSKQETRALDAYVSERLDQLHV